MYDFNVHDHLKNYDVPTLKDITDRDRLPFAVCIINLVGDLNTGIIIRTANLMGAEKVFVFGRRRYDRRSTVGSHNYVDVVQAGGFDDDGYVDPVKFHKLMTENNYTPVMIETGGACISTFSTDKIDKKPCLVFGNEGEGIHPDILRQGKIYSIPQRGVIRSLNVSSAASIAMWEVSKSLISLDN